LAQDMQVYTFFSLFHGAVFAPDARAFCRAALPQETLQMIEAWMPGFATLGYICMALVALQVGLQPVVTRLCVNESVSARSLVLAENAVTLVLSLSLTKPDAFLEWSAAESLMLAGPPALIYSLRSLFKQGAYRRCDGVTFNIINQTKTVFCAVAAWFLLGEGQTPRQCLALFCAVAAGALLIVPDSTLKRLLGGSSGSDNGALESSSKVAPGAISGAAGKDGAASVSENLQAAVVASGLALAIATAVCSGLAAALSQLAFRRVGARPSTLFTFELALWGAPLAAVLGSVGRVGSPATSTGDSKALLQGWRLRTIAPVALQSVGGILVGAVVKAHGGVAMGLCTIVGIAVSAAADAAIMRRRPSLRQAFAGALAASSIVAHQRGS